MQMQIHAKQYDDLLIAPACICMLCIARYLTLDMGMPMKSALSPVKTNQALVCTNEKQNTMCIWYRHSKKL